MERFSLTTIALIAVCISGLYRLLRVGRRPKGYPPGPPTLPILGNIHQMPTRDGYLQFQKWAQEYGDVYSLMLGTKTLIVLSSDEAVKELLDRRSANYSARMDMYIGQELCSGNLRMLMMTYGPEWRMVRKMVHNLLNVSSAHRFVPYQMLENRQMLNDLLDTPDQFLEHIRRYANALTTTMVFGWRTSTYKDKDVQQLFDGFDEFSEINQTGAAALLDSYPVLRKLPDFVLPAQRKAKELHRIEKQLYLKHWLKAKKAIQDGDIIPCFCVGMAEVQEKEGFSDDLAAYTSGTLLEAGSDTTSSTMYGFVQAMLLYPEVQRKAQEEIEQVVGSSRMPTMEDAPNLPYIRSILKETCRWMPTVTTGAVPHAATADDTYKGFIIPKGAGVMNNVWAINMDPNRSPHPRQFDPDRYKDDTLGLYESALHADVTKRDHFTFGAGRRICPGMHVAERSLFLGMSRLLWTFDIEPAKDSSGNDVLPDQEKLTQGFVCMPEPYSAKITPRSSERAELVRKEWKTAQAEHLDPTTKQWTAAPF